MGPVVRILCSIVKSGLALGSAGAVSLAVTAAFAEAAPGSHGSSGSSGSSRSAGSSNSSGSPGSSVSHGSAASKSHAQIGRALGKAKVQPSPAFCRGSIDQLNGLEVYNIAVTVVQGAQDAVQRAAARLPDNRIPGPRAKSAEVQSLISQVDAEPWSVTKVARLRLLQRQYEYLVAAEDLAAKQQAQAQARQFASHGIAMSHSAVSTLQSGC